MVRAHLQEAPIILARLADEDRLHRRLHVVVDAAPADPAIEQERLVVGVEDQLLGLPEVHAHKRHAAVRQLHVRRLDHQRQTPERDRLVTPVELVRLARGKAHRYERLGRNPCPLVPPDLHEPMHAVVGAIIAAPAQLLEQALRRPTLAPGQFRFLLQDLGQNLDPLAKLRRRLHAALVLEHRLLPADHPANRRPRHPKRTHDLLDGPVLLEMGAPNLADLVHANHPPKPFPAAQGSKEGTLAHSYRGGQAWTRKSPLRGSVLRANLHPSLKPPKEGSNKWPPRKSVSAPTHASACFAASISSPMPSR